MASLSDEILALAVSGLWGPRSATLGAVIGDKVSQALRPKPSARTLASQKFFAAIRAPSQRRSPAPAADQPAARAGPPTGAGLALTGSNPSRCNFLRASLRARRTASAFS